MHYDRSATPAECKFTRIVSQLTASLILMACAGATTPYSATNVEQLDRPDRSVSRQNVIRGDEIRATMPTAYDVIRVLRPRYLTAGHADTVGRGTQRVVAVIDNGLPEPIDVLKQIPADHVLEIRFVDPTDAVIKYGPAFTGGVVLVKLGRARLLPPFGFDGGITP